MNKYNYYSPLLIQNFGKYFFWVLYKIFVKLEIRGEENLLDIKGPFILAANHTSELDGTVIPIIFPFFSSIFPIYWVANKTERYKTCGWRGYFYGSKYFSLVGAYAVFSGHKNYEISLDNHIKLLRKGKTVCIFPEGKRTLDGQLNPARGGLGYLVYVTNIPVLPISIDTFFNLSFIDFITRRRKVVVTIGKPMTKNEIINVSNPTVDDFRIASQKVLDKIKEMLS